MPCERSDEDDRITPQPFACEGVSEWGHPTEGPNKSVHKFTGDTLTKTECGTPYNKDSTPYVVFCNLLSLCWWRRPTDIFTITWTELTVGVPNYLTLPNPKMFLYLQIIVKMGHDLCGSLVGYWSTVEQFLTCFYGSVMKRDRFFHAIWFLHFSNSDSATDKNNPDCNRLWNWEMFVTSCYSKYYAHSEHLAVDKVTALLKGRVNFNQYIHKKFSMCDELREVTDWPAVTQSNGRHESGQENFFFHLLIHDSCEQLLPPDMWCQNDT